MDSLTHIVMGAAIGELMVGRKAGKKAMLLGALATSAPDIDIVTSFFVNDATTLVLHRGITHALIVALTAGPLIGFAFARLFPAWKISAKTLMLLFTVGMLLHDLLDACTIYGTGLLMPFSNARISFDNIFVADPLYTLPMLLAFITLLILSAKNRLRYHIAAWGLILSSVYMAGTFVVKSRAEATLNTALADRNITAVDHFTAPTLLNAAAWNLVAKVDSGFWVGYWSIFQKESGCKLYFLKQNNHLLGNLGDSTDVQRLIWFSKGFYCLTEEQGRIYLNDLRFGQVEGWNNPHSTFAFRYDLHHGADNSIVIQRGRIEGSKRALLRSLWKFIKQ